MLEDNQENVEVTNMTETQYFERECDQKLFEVLSNAKAAPLEDDLKTAKHLLSEGSDINARSFNLDIPGGFLLPCALDDLTYQPQCLLLDVLRFCLNNGFDPKLDNGVCGAQTLCHFFKFNFPNVSLLTGIKDLLRAGCDPTVKAYLFRDEPRPENALYYIREELADAFSVDDDFLSMLGYAAIHQCLVKRSKQQNFESVEPVTEALNCSINAVFPYGDFSIEPTATPQTWTYARNSASKDPFDCGLIFDCGRTRLCLDPFWGAYCDKEIKVDDTAQRIDFALPPEASLRKISGEMLNQPGFANFLFDLGSCFLNCNDLTKTISIRASVESKKAQNAQELLASSCYCD